MGNVFKGAFKIMESLKTLTALDIEIALAEYFNPRANLIVPNVSWGMFLHECDLLVITKAGYAWEVEIKTTKQDLIRDKLKRHNHNSNKIKFLYFAIPDYLLNHQEHIPERAGIIAVKYDDYRRYRPIYCKRVRMPQVNSKYKFTTEERYQIARLGAIRIWNLKRNIRDYHRSTQNI